MFQTMTNMRARLFFGLAACAMDSSNYGGLFETIDDPATKTHIACDAYANYLNGLFPGKAPYIKNVSDLAGIRFDGLYYGWKTRPSDPGNAASVFLNKQIPGSGAKPKDLLTQIFDENSTGLFRGGATAYYQHYGDPFTYSGQKASVPYLAGAERGTVDGVKKYICENFNSSDPEEFYRKVTFWICELQVLRDSCLNDVFMLKKLETVNSWPTTYLNLANGSAPYDFYSAGQSLPARGSKITFQRSDALMPIELATRELFGTWYSGKPNKGIPHPYAPYDAWRFQLFQKVPGDPDRVEYKWVPNTTFEKWKSSQNYHECIGNYLSPVKAIPTPTPRPPGPDRCRDFNAPKCCVFSGASGTAIATLEKTWLCYDSLTDSSLCNSTRNGNGTSPAFWLKQGFCENLSKTYSTRVGRLWHRVVDWTKRPSSPPSASPTPTPIPTPTPVYKYTNPCDP